MKITKEVIACWIIGAILVIFGTSVESYVFEALAIVVIAFGVVLSVFWNDIFKTNEEKQQKKEE